jgi:protein SCO1/2
MKTRSFLLKLVSFAALLAVLAAGCGAAKPALRGAIIDPPGAAPEINLTDHNGHPFRMSDQRGKVVLLSFGFVNCTDECPLTMAHLKIALEALGDGAQNVQVVMVSTDPARDTPAAMKGFLGNFSPAFIGLPGALDELTKVWTDYSVEVEDGGEAHSSFVYVIDRNGKARETFTPDSEPEDIAADLKVLLAEK